jgi:hypothetical protein
MSKSESQMIRMAPQPLPPAVPTAGKIPGYENMSFEQRRLAQDQPRKVR